MYVTAPGPYLLRAEMSTALAQSSVALCRCIG